MGSEKFCLRWNDFESNISVAFRELKDDQDFFDVTLACDDKATVEAHKVILSACSPFFREVLKRTQNRHHPLLYLKGVRFSDLEAVLNFMYHGEVNVAQDELNSFLAVAEELRVKGLTQQSSQKSTAGGSNSDKNTVKSAKGGGDSFSSGNSNSSTISGHNANSSSAGGTSSALSSRHRSKSPTTAKQSLTSSYEPSGSSSSRPSSIGPAAKRAKFSAGDDNMEDDDDDIQEVVPVKSEPRDHATGSSSSSSNTTVGAPTPSSTHQPQPSFDGALVQQGGGDGGELIGTEEADYDPSSYDDFGDYEAGGYDESGATAHMAGPGGQDSNKGLVAGLPSDFTRYVVRNSQTDGPSWACGLCDAFKHKSKYNVQNHIESCHFPKLFTYYCRYCGKESTSRNTHSSHESKCRANPRSLQEI